MPADTIDFNKIDIKDKSIRELVNRLSRTEMSQSSKDEYKGWIVLNF